MLKHIIASMITTEFLNEVGHHMIVQFVSHLSLEGIELGVEHLIHLVM